MSRQSWDDFYLAMAHLVASRSRDPGTKVGAVIVRPDKTIASLGYNGLPRGIADDDRLGDRDWKLAATVHAEVNALLNAREPVRGYTLYVAPLHPCSNCAAQIIQAGIRHVVAEMPTEVPERWRDSFRIARGLLVEAGISTDVRNAA